MSGGALVSPKDVPSRAKLEARLLASHEAVRIARENLIEALGDHMCGSGSGPTSRDLRALAHACRVEAKIRRDLAELATMCTLKRLQGPHGSTGPRLCEPTHARTTGEAIAPISNDVDRHRQRHPSL
jgi:hypothetical protein